ncbi:hypothetical protein [Leptospira harrisiae]|uniref:hypothetical protein n=1 Tax=Leptospira harrisiae TaxID=2023189 RepID=UPI001FAFAFCA|nr:hypothetical protein [Leptospira harrisiae]
MRIKPEIPALLGAVGVAINILQVPVVTHEDDVELLEVELLFATSARAPAVVVSLLVFPGSQETSKKQVKLIMIRFDMSKEFAKFLKIFIKFSVIRVIPKVVPPRSMFLEIEFISML